jgi:hypothetical protein
MIALNILRDERSDFIDSNSLIDPATHEPIPGTLDADALEVVAEYDAAIAEVEGMVAAVDSLEELHAMVWGECPSLLNEDSGGCERLDSEIRAALAKARGQ